MGLIFWDSQGMIMIDYLEQGRLINGANYAGNLRQLCQEIARNRQGKLTRDVLLLQDNAPAHISQVVINSVPECGFDLCTLTYFEILPYLLFSPDMAPSDSYLFQKLKFQLHGTQHGSNKAGIEAANEHLGDQKKAFYFDWIRKLERRWAK